MTIRSISNHHRVDTVKTSRSDHTPLWNGNLVIRVLVKNDAVQSLPKFTEQNTAGRNLSVPEVLKNGGELVNLSLENSSKTEAGLANDWNQFLPMSLFLKM